MITWLCASLVAGWLVNVLADAAPERRSFGATWFWALAQLPVAYQEKLGLTSLCANCPARRPWRYLLVWGAAVVLGWFAYQRLGLSSAAFILALQAWFFLAIAVIDLEHRRVLNNMLLPAAPLLIAFDWLTGMPSLTSALLGAATGFGLFLLLAIIRPGGMGMGDVKLAGVIGLATGFNGVVGAMMIGILTGGLAAVVVLLRQRSTRGQTIAYAPYLVLGAWAALYYGVHTWRF